MGIWETSTTSVGAEAPKLAGDETAAAVREAARRNRKGGVTTEAVGELDGSCGYLWPRIASSGSRGHFVGVTEE